jgi:hypothetical protein
MGTGAATILPFCLPVSLSAVYRVKTKSAFPFPFPYTIWEKHRGQIPASYSYLKCQLVHLLISPSRCNSPSLPTRRPNSIVWSLNCTTSRIVEEWKIWILIDNFFYSATCQKQRTERGELLCEWEGLGSIDCSLVCFNHTPKIRLGEQ